MARGTYRVLCMRYVYSVSRGVTRDQDVLNDSLFVQLLSCLHGFVRLRRCFNSVLWRSNIPYGMLVTKPYTRNTGSTIYEPFYSKLYFLVPSF